MTSTTRTTHQLRRLTLVLTATVGLGLMGWTMGTGTTTPNADAAAPAMETAAPMGCWTEWKPDGTSERMYGDLGLEPAGSAPLDCEAFGEPVDPADGPELVPSVQEDEPAFDCRTKGNRTCGPGNDDGVTAGCYVGGQLVVAWSESMRGVWSNCGPVTGFDVEQQRKLDGLVAQVCEPNAQGGVTCTWAE